jgi:hypothetical protein
MSDAKKTRRTGKQTFNRGGQSSISWTNLTRYLPATTQGITLATAPPSCLECPLASNVDTCHIHPKPFTDQSLSVQRTPIPKNTYYNHAGGDTTTERGADSLMTQIRWLCEPALLLYFIQMSDERES